MKNFGNTSKSLGLKQEEMALLLGVSRAQWSMYVTGARSLPTAAMVKLSEMQRHIATSKTEKPPLPAEKPQDQILGHLAKLLQENLLKQKATARKIKTEKAQSAIDEGRMHLEDFLSSKDKQSHEEIIHRLIGHEIRKAAEKNHPGLLAALEIKLEVLQFEEQLLRKKFEK